MIRAILLARATAATLRGRRSSNCSSQVLADLLPGFAYRTTDIAPTTSNWRSRSLPALLIPPIRCFPPVECSRGVSPSHAVKWARKMGPGVKLEKCRSVVIDGASDDDEDETED